MEEAEIELKTRELRLQKRGQDLGVAKFLVGGILIGLLGFFLDLDKLLHTKKNDDRNFLVQQIEMLRESNPSKRLENIKFLQEINGAPSQYLNDLESEALAEIEEMRLAEEAAARTAERKRLEALAFEEREKAKAREIALADEKARREAEKERLEREAREKQEIEKARNDELAAIAEKEAAQKQRETARLAITKSNDAALQEAYPGVSLMELRKRGAILP